MDPSPDLVLAFLILKVDGLEQCKAIFEEYTPKTNGKASPKHAESTTVEPKFKVPEDPEEPTDVSRKRVARDGAIKPMLQVPQRNLKLNPMQQIYKRQEAMRKMVETQAAVKQPNQNRLPSSLPTNLPPVKGKILRKCLKYRYAKKIKLETNRFLIYF